MGSESEAGTLIERFVSHCLALLMRIPPIIPGISGGLLEAPRRMLQLPHDVESRMLTASCIVALPLILVATLAGSPALFIAALSMAATLCAALLLLPVVLYRLRRASAVQDTLAFMLHFLTAARHANLEHAYLRAAASTQGEAYRRGWSRLVAGYASDVPSLLRMLADEMRMHAEQLHTALRVLAREVSKPKPDFDRVLADVTAGIRVLAEYEVKVFAAKLQLATTAAITVPFSAFLMLPPVLSVAGSTPAASFAATGVLSLSAIAVSVLYAAAHLPSHLCTLLRSPSQQALSRFCDDSHGWLRSRRAGAVLIGVAAFLSVLHPVLAIAAAGAMLLCARIWSCLDRYISAVSRQLSELPVMLRELAADIAMEEPPERALRRSGAAPGFRSALISGSAEELYPERTFLIVTDVLRRLKDSGSALAAALHTLQSYISRMQEQRTLVAAKLEDARATVRYLFFMLPLGAMLSVIVFKKLSDIMQHAGMAGSELLGFSIVQMLFSGSVDPLPAYSAVALTAIAGMLISLPLLIACEDLVHPDLMFPRLRYASAGLAIVGLGGIVLLAL